MFRIEYLKTKGNTVEAFFGYTFEEAKEYVQLICTKGGFRVVDFYDMRDSFAKGELYHDGVKRVTKGLFATDIIINCK